MGTHSRLSFEIPTTVKIPNKYAPCVYAFLLTPPPLRKKVFTNEAWKLLCTGRFAELIEHPLIP